MRKEEIIKALREDMSVLRTTYGVQSIGLFGSYATGKNHPGSDLDFLVELSAPLADNYFGLWDYLEKRFQKKIDLLRKGNHVGVKFLNSIQEDIVYA